MARKSDYSNWSKEDVVKRIEALENRKKYGLVWDEEREPEKVVQQCKAKLPILKEVKNKEIKNGSDKPTHILIEGDNYHALSVLNYTHEKAIDVIYIDPPFNTGAKDWKYNNNYVDENDAYRHSKWLSFMNNRLKIAKNLLKPDGVLICAIDDNEQVRLGLLLEYLFHGYKTICVTIVHNPRGVQGKNFASCHEYAYFVYPDDGDEYIGKQKREKESWRNLRDNGGESLREDAQNCFYSIYAQDSKIVDFGDVPNDDFHPEQQSRLLDNGLIEIWPIDGEGIERKWRYARDGVVNLVEKLRCKKYRESYQIQLLKDLDRYRTVWTGSRYDSNEYGSKLLNRIIDEDFPYPKSLYNVRDCLYAVVQNKKDAIVLDYFAGSGTTGHALLDINAEDGGNRQFMLVTNNENNIATDVCYPRMKKIINGYEDISNEKELIFEEKLTISKLGRFQGIYEDFEEAMSNNEPNFDELTPELKNNVISLFGIKNINGIREGYGGNLKYYKTDFVPASPTDRNKEKLTKQSVEMLCLREDTFDFVLEEHGFRIYKNHEKYTGIIFDQLDIPDFKVTIKDYEKPISVYVFSLSDDDFAEEFEDMKDKVKVCSIPEAILRVYRRIFK